MKNDREEQESLTADELIAGMTGTATVELPNAPRVEGELKIEPTHPASTMRH